MNTNSRSQHNSKLPRKWRGIDYIAAVIVLAIVLFALVAAVNYIKFLRLDMVRAEQKTELIAADAKVIVIRNEKPVKGLSSGYFAPLLEEGEKVKTGGAIGYLNDDSGKSTAVTADIGGLVYYQLDGWEELLNPDNILSIDWPSVFEQFAEQEQASEELSHPVENLGAGRSVAKIIDNLTVPYFCFYVTEDISEFINDNRIKVLFEDIEAANTLWLNLEENDEMANSSHYIVASYKVDEPFFHDYRYGNAKIIGETISGIAVPATAIFTNEQGKTGVFLRSRKQIVFREVTLLYEDEEIALVQELTATDMVVTNPERAKEGQRVY